MLCPKCQNTMREREKGDVIVDVCPACRGIWLEAGELEKLIESERRFYNSDDDDARYPGDGPHRVEQYRCRDDIKPQTKQKGSFLSNVFEAFGGEGSG